MKFDSVIRPDTRVANVLTALKAKSHSKQNALKTDPKGGGLFSLIVFLLLINVAFGQVNSLGTETDLTSKLPRDLQGEWYHPTTAGCTFGFYEKGAVFEGKFWHYERIDRNNKAIDLTLVGENGQHATLVVELNADRLNLVSSSEKEIEPLTYFRDKQLCNVVHNLRAIPYPELSKDSVYLNYYLNDSMKEPISVREQPLVIQTGFIHFQGLDQNGMAHMAIAVERPTFLEIHLPYIENPQEVMLLPGSNITILQTGSKVVYGGSGALFASEMQELFKRQQFGSRLSVLSVLRKKYTDNYRPEPLLYKRELLSVREDLLDGIDSLKRVGEISPLSYQIGRYNVIYAVADALLHYTDNCKLYWLRNPYDTVSHTEVKGLPMSYFDFLKGLDDDGAIIAPAYRNFVETLRSSDAGANLPPIAAPQMDPVGHIQPKTLAKLLLPLEHMSKPLTDSQRGLLRTVQEENDSAKLQRIIAANQGAFTTLSTDYFAQYAISTASNFLLELFKTEFDWQPGILTDLLAAGNVIQQLLAQGATEIPDDFFEGKHSLLSNRFVAARLLDKKRQNVESVKQAAATVKTGSIDYNSKEEWIDVRPEQFVSWDTIKRGGLTLIFANNMPGFSQQIKDSMIKTFFAVYPRELQAYNPNAVKEVYFVIDSGCPLLAATVQNVVRYQPRWFDDNPKDYDVVTHEAMHIVQAYQRNHYEPRWLTEGIADYVRQIYGLHNEEANWSLPPLSTTMSYRDGYRITARFLYWITEHKDKDFVKFADSRLREDAYTDNLWKERTGKELDELWDEYTTSPQIDLSAKHLN